MHKGLALAQFTFIQQISILKISRIPKIENSEVMTVRILKYGLQFEGHLRALETENDKRLDILFCYLEGTAFSTCVI